MKTCSIAVPEETYDQAVSMADSVAESYRLQCLLVNRQDLAGRVGAVTVEGVLSLAAVMGVNGLLRSHGRKLPEERCGAVVAGEQIAVTASRSISSLEVELAKTKQRCKEQEAVIERFGDSITSLSGKVKALELEVEVNTNADVVRKHFIDEVYRWLVTSETPHDLLVRLKGLELPDSKDKQAVTRL